jgi:hypothetical protein
MSFANVTSPHARRPIHRLRPIWLLLAVSCWLSAVSAQPFPSFLLDTSVVIVPDAGEANWTSVAFGDQFGLVVWTDGNLVKGCRFTPSLAPLDTPGIPLSRVTSKNVPQVEVAWSRDTFLTVWQGDGDNGAVITGALVSEAETEVRRVTLDSSAMVHHAPVVASNSSGFLIAWAEYSLSGGLDRSRYARVTRSGVVLDSTPRLVAVHQGAQAVSGLAWGDTSYMVVWSGCNNRDTGVFCNIIRSDGARASDFGYLVYRSDSYTGPVVSYDGRNFIVVWERRFNPDYELWGVRVSPDGVVLDSPSVSLVQGIESSRWHGVASVRDTSLLVWESLRDGAWWAFGVRLDSSLRVLDSAPVALSLPVVGADDVAPAGISCASTGDTFVISWAGYLGPTNFHTPGRDVVCRRVTAGGVLPESAAVLMSYAASGQFQPDVASDGADFAAVWQEYRTDSTLYDSRLYCMRFSRTGAVLDSAPKCLDGPDVRGPNIGYGGGFYLVVWETGLTMGTPRVLAVRIDRAGTLIDTVPILVASGAKWAYRNADVGYVDSTFLIATQANYPYWHIYGSRISCDGRLLDSVPFLFQLDSSQFQRRPAIACDGDTTFIVTRFHPSPLPDEARALRLTSGGVILDTAEIVLGDVPGHMSEPLVAVVRGPGEYFIFSTSSAWPTIAWRVSYEGAVLDTVEGVYPFWPGTEPVYDGINYVVANLLDPPDIGAVRIRPDGTVIDSPPVTVVVIDTNKTCFSWSARIATNDEGITAIVFGTYEQERYGSKRLRAAVWAPLGVGAENRSRHSTAFSIHPNPVAGTAVLELGSRIAGPVRIRLYDVQGRLTKLLADVPAGMGPARIPVDLRDVPSGVYFVDMHPAGIRTKLVVVTR